MGVVHWWMPLLMVGFPSVSFEHSGKGRTLRRAIFQPKQPKPFTVGPCFVVVVFAGGLWPSARPMWPFSPQSTSTQGPEAEVPR